MSSPTNFAILYTCGHLRTFQVKEIFAKSYDPDIEAQDGANKVTSTSPFHDIDIGTARKVNERSKKVSWQAGEASSPESSPSSSLSLQPMDPLYFYPNPKRSDTKVFERWEDCPACKDEASDDNSISEEMEVAQEIMSGAICGESDAGSDEALSFASGEIEMEADGSDGYWDVFQVGDYLDEGQYESDRDEGLVSSFSSLDVKTEEEIEGDTDSEQDIGDEEVEFVELI
ncbi:MAG: hypothetical protein Q9183_001767 [Haloplaca sp. 2 TL-2023]